MGCRDLHSGSVGNQKRHHDDKQRSNATSPFEWWSCCCSLDSQASLHLPSSFSAQTLWYANHANQASCFLGWWKIWPMFSSPYCPLTYHPQPLLFRRLWCVRFIIDLFTFISVTNGVTSPMFPPSRLSSSLTLSSQPSPSPSSHLLLCGRSMTDDHPYLVNWKVGSSPCHIWTVFFLMVINISLHHQFLKFCLLGERCLKARMRRKQK